MTKRMIAIILSLSLLCALPAGCGLRLSGAGDLAGTSGQNEAETENESALHAIDTLKIAYNNTDSLNPYLAASTMNLNVISLLYDPLVKLDQQYNAHNIIAEDIQLTAQQCVVTIKQGVQFSNGAAVTADDVVYSAKQVLAEGNSYSGLLSGVSEVTATDSRTVVFTLNTPDRLFANLLTFPIVSEANPLIGSGRYVLQGSGENAKLTVNPNWYGDNKSQIKTIELVNQLDKDTLIYSLKLGTINYVYSDLSGNDALSLGISTQRVPLNHLVYLGMNSTKKILSDVRMRKALNLCINRAELVGSTYASRAVEAHTPFNPQWAEVAALSSKQQQDFGAAAALLEELGYKPANKDSEGYYTTSRGRLRLRLLVNSENSSRVQVAEELKKTLKEFGIELVIDAKTFDAYKTALAQWDFDLYLGEVKLYNNMNLTSMLSSKAKLGFGVVDNEAMIAANSALMAGTIDTQAFIDAFYNFTPFIPLMYRSGMVSFSRETYFDASATEQDIFYNIELW
ncbi:ABC transporter substrate-binding protein [Hydrogenoanaerobacterium sp.]|uniref:ABC transporter substrate-binding protein n=1 Tax=Hydrogenoanaerobacterium sp. TaxID=2953763 RepID=UPI0028968F6E|nr:ABC transporter substrate-binding protein [Hydrogenoanaerobacterium sp.]